MSWGIECYNCECGTLLRNQEFANSSLSFMEILNPGDHRGVAGWWGHIASSVRPIKTALLIQTFNWALWQGLGWSEVSSAVCMKKSLAKKIKLNLCLRGDPV